MTLKQCWQDCRHPPSESRRQPGMAGPTQNPSPSKWGRRFRLPTDTSKLSECRHEILASTPEAYSTSKSTGSTDGTRGRVGYEDILVGMRWTVGLLLVLAGLGFSQAGRGGTAASAFARDVLAAHNAVRAK